MHYTFTQDLALYSGAHMPDCTCCGAMDVAEYRGEGFPAEIGDVWLCEKCISQAGELAAHATKLAADLNLRAIQSIAFAKSIAEPVNVRVVRDIEELDP